MGTTSGGILQDLWKSIGSLLQDTKLHVDILYAHLQDGEVSLDTFFKSSSTIVERI